MQHYFCFFTYVLNVSYHLCFIGFGVRTVIVVTDPVGTPIDGHPNTLDYTILSNVTLMCVATETDGSPAMVTSYRWTAKDCYNHTDGVEDPCFYDGGHTGQNITGNDLLAQDAGTVTCTAIICGIDYSSDPLTLRISGKQLNSLPEY